MSTPAEVENKYVKLHENGDVTFYGECIDASGGDLEGWGFFYSSTNTTPGAGGAGVQQEIVVGPVTAGNFSTTVTGLSHGIKYFVNAYLYDSESGDYFYHNGAGNTAPGTGLWFAFPDIETVNPPSTITTTSANLGGSIGEINTSEHDINSVGFDIDEGNSIGGGFVRLTGTPGTSWNTTATGLVSGTEYTYQAWIEVEESSASTATIGISGETVQFQTTSVPPSVVEAVTATFSETGSGAGFRTNVEFAGQMDSSGTGITIADTLGFFYKDATNPSNDPGAGTDKPSDVDPIEGSVPKDFSIDAFEVALPGQDYYVNAYAKLDGSDDDDYYYSNGQGHSNAPTGKKYRIPKVIEPTPVETTAVLENDGANFKVTFNAKIDTDGIPDNPYRKGFYYFTNETIGDHYPSKGDPGLLDASSGWLSGDTAFEEEVTPISVGDTYWVRGMIEDASGVNFYTTGTGSATPLPARSFYIPSVDTPTSGTVTSTTYTLSSLSLNDVAGYEHGGTNGTAATPPIFQKGYYLKQKNGSAPNFTVADRYIDDVSSDWHGNSGVSGWPLESATATWGAITFEELEYPKKYWYQPYALVKKYVGASTYFEILGNIKHHFTTINPLEVTNTPDVGDFIKVHEGGSSSMGNGEPFRNITVTGHLESIGEGATLCQEVGFFVIDAASGDKPSYSAAGGGDGNIGQLDYEFGSLPIADDYPIATDSNGGALYTPGTTYYVNFYGTPVKNSTNFNDYYYEDGQNTPPVGNDFQIPDVRNSTIYFTNENQMKLRGVVVKGDNTSYSGAPGPMTPIKYGFVYTLTTPPGGQVSPHKDTASTVTYEGSETDWSVLVADTPSETDYTFEKVINFGASPPERGTEYFINAFIEDNNNIIYYPLSGAHMSFKIPEPKFFSEGTKGSTSMILNGTLEDYAGWGGIPEIGVYGFIYDLDEANVESGTEVNATAGGNETSFSSNLTGLEGFTKYYYRVFVKVKKHGSGGGEYTMFSEESPTPNFTTLPDFGDVLNNDPEFVTGYKIKLNGTVNNVGSGDASANYQGFFIHTAPNPGVSYVSGGPNTQNGDKYTYNAGPPIAAGSFFETIPFDAFPPGKNTAAMAGTTYWINAWVDDPTASDENGNSGLASGYRYHGDVSEPPTGMSFTLPNLVSHPLIPPNMLDAWNGNPATPTFDVKLFGKLDVPSKINGDIASGTKKGFFWHTAQQPGNGTGTKVEHAEDPAASGEYDMIVVGLEDETDYYFNAYAFDGANYYYNGASTTYPDFSIIPDGDNFKLPAVTIDAISDISGDAVKIYASNNALTNFTIEKVGLYLESVSQADEDPDNSEGPNNWNITKGPPLDTNDDKLGGNKDYDAQAFIKINGKEILSVPLTFTTETWPVITYKDISRNVTSSVGNNTGFLLMETHVQSFGAGSNAKISTGQQSQLGFYIGDAIGVRSGYNPYITQHENLSQNTVYFDKQNSSSGTGKYLDRGKLYYSNTFVSQKNPPPVGGNVEPNNYQYYGFYHKPSYTTDASCTTLARANAGGTFPDGISFIIPDISNSDPEIIDSSTVKLKLYLDSSGHTVDVPGTDTLGFFFNHTDNPGADASCNNQAFSSQTVFDVSNVLIPWSNKISGTYHLDASGLKQGQNYYYTGYTALLGEDRGESVDGDDYWYPYKYSPGDSSDVVSKFCIGDPSCNPKPEAKDLTTTDLSGVTYGSVPLPPAETYGFTYWFDGSYNLNNIEEKSGTFHGGQRWDQIKLENLHDSTRYYAMPYVKQSGNYIYGDKIVWYTDLKICEVGLNNIGDFQYGNDNGGSSNGEGSGDLTGDASGSQTRYKLIGIDASLNTNPPNNFEVEDLSGTVVFLGLCWKVTDQPLVSPPIESDFSKNLIDGSYNAWKDVNQTAGAKDVFRDASYNIYDASINDLSYNTMYSLRTIVKNEPIIDNNLVAGAEQEGGGYGYSDEKWFITPLPKVIINDPSATQVPLANVEHPFASYAPNIFTKIGISGEILDNPDEASGNIIEYGFLFKMFTPSATPTPPVYSSFDNETCDISTNLLGVGFYPDNVIDTSFNIADSSSVPYKFFQSLSLHPEEDVKDLSYNRQYYFGSYARNLSDHYLKHPLVIDAIDTGKEPYINTEGITSYKKYNDSSGVLITPWPAPYIRILDLDKPITLTKASLYTFVNVSLEIFNYDPTRWGGIAEFGVIWEKSQKLKDSGIDPNDFTTQYMDGSGNWVGADGSGGWYRRGCSGEPVENDFGEPVDGSRNGGWFWDKGGSEEEGAGWQYDASFSSGGFPDGNENASCRWPPGANTYVKLGVYNLGLGDTANLYPSILIDHKPSGTGSAQDPSSIPFNTDESYWLRPYIISRNKGFWVPPDGSGNPRDQNGTHPDSSFNVFWGPPKNLTFDLDLVDVRTGHTGEDINWFQEGYTGDGSEIWPTMLDPGIDSADMSGNILANPIIGNPPRGRVIKYGFLWWDGGKTASDGPGALQWPGQDHGFGPKIAAGNTIPNLGFTLANTTWPPDGSNNYCVAMEESTQIGYGWNTEANGRTTYDLSGTNFDISANDLINAGREGTELGEGYGEGGISVASLSGYYWNTNPQASDDGWYKLAFPRNNPPWPGSLWDPTTRSWSAKTGPNGEAAVIHSQSVVFDVKKTSREGTKDRRLFNSTVWYRAYAINSYFNPESGEEAQIGISYGSVGRLELKKSVNFGVDMVNPVLVSSNIGTRSILVRGTLLGNMDGQGNPIIENYGFCWRKLVENHAQDKDGNPIPNSEREPTWYYDAVSKTWVDKYISYPPPTVIDSSMVALGIRAEDTSGAGFAWSDEGGVEQYPLRVDDPSNQEVAEFDPSGEFPGEIFNASFPGFTQNPPPFKFGEREWSFHYKIGSDGEELEAEGGIKDPAFVGFDASGGKLSSNTYYLIRAWVKGPIDPGTLEQDNGESASGIKYGPIWYINSENQEENKKKGWLALTKPLEKCSLDLIETVNLTYKSVILRSKLLTNPNPSRLNKYGFVYMLDDASGNGLPTIEDNLYVLLPLPTNLNDLAAPPPKIMEKKISIIPNSYYTIRAFADNSFKSYISYDSSGNPEGSSTNEGGVIYSNPYTILSDFCPPAKSNMISGTDVSYTSIQLKGLILNNFGGLISKHGFIVGEGTMPIINDGSSFEYDLGSKNNLGNYTYFTTGLKYNTTYFARSFAYHPGAREDLRLHYGSLVITFQTLNPDPPEIISTKQIENGQGSVSATFGSEIKDTSGIELLSSYGFCWTTRVVPLSGKAEYTGDPGDEGPADNELKIENADNYSEYTNLPSSFPFFFKTILTNLQPSTTYYIRSYAKINPIGYGQVFTFTTLDEPCECIPATAKPIGALRPNKSSKMLCAEAIKRHGSAIIGTRGVTPNLL